MPANDKEINCNLFDQLTILDDIQEIAEKENAVETLKIIAKKRRQAERKRLILSKSKKAVYNKCIRK